MVCPHSDYEPIEQLDGLVVGNMCVRCLAALPVHFTVEAVYEVGSFEAVAYMVFPDDPPS